MAYLVITSPPPVPTVPHPGRNRLLPSLTTEFAGLELSSPIIAGSAAITKDTDMMKRAEDAGAGAVIMKGFSDIEDMRVSPAPRYRIIEHELGHRSAFTFYSYEQASSRDAEAYAEELARACEEIHIPVIANVDCQDTDSWVENTRIIAQAHPAALEINVSCPHGSIAFSGQDVERRIVEVVEAVRATVQVPLIVKLTPQLTSPLNLVKRIEDEAIERSKEKARRVISMAIQRIASEHVVESTVSVLDLPSDDMKGRIIGREGRNIRAFEQATGVDLIVDDTPGAVILSCFEPVRREIARLALERLVQDGRIHPARIEEVVAATTKEVNELIVEAGKQAAMDADVHGLHPKEIGLLGRLHFRTSYGQSVLKHSLEVAYLASHIAGELGLDAKLAKRCGLLHDIGKAVDHEVEGGHPQIGADLARRYGERDEVVNAIAAHHEDVPATSIYTTIVAAADAISASRPGARRETLEKYIKRLQRLEELATSFEGVENAYAIQAGREIRVIVDSAKVSDSDALRICRNIAHEIEKELSYPGEVKVTLIRETRVVEYAR